MTFSTKHISICLNKPANEVYRFVSNPANLPKWASGLGDSITKTGDEWVADSPMGQIKVKFAEENTFGILDHNVTLPSGETFYNPMRVFPNHEGSEIVFTLYKLSGVSDEQFEKDSHWVKGDLKKLKEILEAHDF